MGSVSAPRGFRLDRSAGSCVLYGLLERESQRGLKHRAKKWNGFSQQAAYPKESVFIDLVSDVPNLPAPRIREAAAGNTEPPEEILEGLRCYLLLKSGYPI